MNSESTPRSLINCPQHISNSRANCFISCTYLKERKSRLVYPKKTAIRNHAANEKRQEIATFKFVKFFLCKG